MPRKQRRQPPARPPTYDLDGDTMLERFHSLLNRYPNSIPTQELASFLAQENCRVFDAFAPEKDPLPLLPQCCSLVQEMREFYGDDILSLVHQNAPLLADLAGSYLQEVASEPMPEEQRERLHRLADHIFSLRGERICTFFLGVLAGCKRLRLPRTILQEDQEDAYADLEEHLLDVAQKEGSLILRYSSGFPGKDFLNGFLFTRAEVHKIPADDLQWAQETMPDGTRQEDPSAIYQVADIDLS